jgi:hypothetical protein
MQYVTAVTAGKQRIKTAAAHHAMILNPRIRSSKQGEINAGFARFVFSCGKVLPA